MAACTFVPTAGNDTFICDSGISPGGLTDLLGSNTLQFPADGTGMLNGNVTFGAGTDRIEINSGTITGTVDQGNGADSFVISGGSVTGNVQQGGGIDDFQMTGGVIQSLNQGDALDTFFMSGGRIIDFFDDGDRAIMTGGRIGRVNMKLDKNYFNMSGGIIDRNLVTGFDDDIVIISDGTIGGNISVSGGNDRVTVTGGSIGGDVLMSFGADAFTWNGGGIIYGTVDLGADNDTATLKDLSNANLGATTAITGGLGTDRLTLNHVLTPGVSRFQNWESIAATNDTQLIFDGNLVLGDAGTGTGSLSVDATSTLYGGGFSSGVSAFAAGQFANVINAGRIDLTNNGGGPSDKFTVSGNYVGNGGMVLLDTVLEDDASASDRLVISGGTASGTTSIIVMNAGGNGAVTVQDGIQVVQALNGATTDNGAFSLNAPVAAGAFEYFLFKGGVSAGTAENWYLRSTLVNALEPAPAPNPLGPSTDPASQPIEPEANLPPPPPQTSPVPPADPNVAANANDPAPVGAPDAPDVPPIDLPPPPPTPLNVVPSLLTDDAPPNAGATRVTADIVPLYRIEVPTYSVVPPAAYELVLANLGTFHERRGEQALLEGINWLPVVWGRVFGQNNETKWSGTVSPTFDGHLLGFQAGADLFGWESASGHRDRAGLFIAHSSMDGDVRGQALGWNDLAVGKLNLDGTSLGAYWTHIGPTGWYLDGILMGTWFGGDATSDRNVGVDIDGSAVTVSLEGGYPIALTDAWTIEPQAQIIWQRLSFDDQQDRFSTVSFDPGGGATGRLGTRLQGEMPFGDMKLQPYLKANIWHDFKSTDTVTFGDDAISTERKRTSLELGGGVVAKFTDTVSLFATADYTTNLGGEKTRVFEGNIGVSVTW